MALVQILETHREAPPLYLGDWVVLPNNWVDGYTGRNTLESRLDSISARLEKESKNDSHTLYHVVPCTE